MRGSPLLRGIVAIGVLLLLAIPIWKLTHKAEAVMAAQPETAAAHSPVTIQLTFAHPASGFQILHLGKVLWESGQPALKMQKDFTLDYPKEGIDLEVKATWPPGTPDTAIRVLVTHDYGSVERTAWAEKSKMDAVLTFAE